METRNHFKNGAVPKSQTSRKIKTWKKMEKVMVEFDLPGVTSKQYDQVWQDLRAVGHENPKGLEHHVGAPTDKGWKVVDVWENVNKFNEFGHLLMPILTKNGIPSIQPVISPVHYEYCGVKPIPL